MGFELLKEADLILDSCGRPMPPPGFKFVDLPRIINFTTVVPGFGEAGETGPATQFRVTNNANTLFLCKGVSVSASDLLALNYRLKWPNGRFFSQNPFFTVQPTVGAVVDATVNGAAGNMLALNVEQPIEKGARIALTHGQGTLNLDFWGVLRYLIKEVDDGREPPGNYCIIGYPVVARNQKRGTWKLELITDPTLKLEALPRYMCGPNQNIMAPEILLGDGPAAGETPAGNTDESFTFFSPSVTVASNNGVASYGNETLVPGSDDVVIKRWRGRPSWDAETAGIPLVNMRLPNGYSVTGGDFMPIGYQWMPFPLDLRIASGTRIILDFAVMDGSGDNIAVVMEFDAVKRTGGRR